MKRIIAIILSTVILLGTLAGCGRNADASLNSVDWHDQQVVMHGVHLKNVGKMTAADLLALGFEKDVFAMAFTAPTVESGESANFSVRATDGGTETYTIKVVNTKDTETAIENCIIKRIYVLEPEPTDKLIIDATDVTLENGVGLGLSSEEVRQKMGDPDEEKIKSGSEDFYKTWTYHANDDGGDIVMMFKESTDKMRAMIISY